METIKKIFFGIFAFIAKIGSFIGRLLNPITTKLSAFLNRHRAFVVRKFALSYETRIFRNKDGSTGKYPRVALPTFIAFLIAIIATVSIDTLGWWEIIQSNGAFFEFILSALFAAFYFIFWVPFIVLIWIGFPWFGGGYFELYPLEYAELVSKGQRFQYLNKPPMTAKDDETFPEGFKYNEEFKELGKWHYSKFGDKKSVNALLGLAVFIVIVIGAYIAVRIMEL